MSTQQTGPRAELRLLIKGFLQERLDGKLEKLSPDDPKRSELQAQFEPSAWLEDAARRVVQIQAVTHSLKPIHPEAKGSSLYQPPQSLEPSAFVGTHCLGDQFESDVVGNAAALDVYKFLKLRSEGQGFLDLAVKGDADFVAVLSDDQAVGRQWAAAFAGLAAGRAKVSSHTNAKQLYWLLDSDDQSAHGDNCLLASVPPVWKSAAVRPLLGVGSMFKVWGRRPSVSLQARALRRFLENKPPANVETRQRVRAWVDALLDELIQFQAELLTLEPGWSQSEDCALPAAQRTWLDPEGQPPGSPIEDTEDDIAGDFARWVNAQLRNPLPVGDSEFAAWRKQAQAQLQTVAREAA